LTVNNATTINGYVIITSYFTAFNSLTGQGVIAGTVDGFGYTTLAPKGFIHWGGGYGSTAVGVNCKDLLTSLSCYYAIVGKGFMSNSDRRIKRDIINIDNGLTIINKLQPRNFNIIETAENQFGFIAQEVNEVEGEIFINGTKVNDFMNIDYNQIVALNTQSIKELYKMIIDLQLKIRILESK